MGKRIKEVTIHQAKTHLSRLLVQVEHGTTIIIKKGNRPVAQLGAIQVPSRKRVLGTERGKIRLATDFDVIPKIFDDYTKK